VLGIIFDGKPNWKRYVNGAICKVKKSFHAIKFLSRECLVQIETSFFIKDFISLVFDPVAQLRAY